MGNKRDRNKGKDDAGQTKSETTVAAHVIFNDPDQPKAPVTTDNIKKTVGQAVREEVQKAFAQKEKQDFDNLQKVIPEAASAAKSNKPKVRLKPQPTPAAPEQAPVKKPKVRLKTAEERINTPTGMSINKLAENLARKEDKPRIRIPASQVPFNAVAEKNPEFMAAQILGKTVSSKNPSLQSPVYDKAEPVSNPDNSTVAVLEQKVGQLEAAAKSEKTTKPMTKEEKAHSRSEAAEYLKALGFKKSEFQSLLDKVDHIEKTEDKILYVLKLKANPHAKIPQAELPQAVAQAREDVKEPVKVEAAKSPEPKMPEQGTLDLQEQPPELKLEPTPGKVGPEPKKPKKPASTEMTAPPAPALPAKTPAPNTPEDLDQAQAAADKAEEEAKKKEKEKKERDKKIEKQLKAIEDKIGGKGIFDLISQGISGLLKNLIGLAIRPLLAFLPALLPVLAGAAAVIATGVAAYVGAKWLLKKVGYTGEGLADVADKVHELFTGDNAKKAAAEAAHKKEFENSQNKKLEGTGYTFSEGGYTDSAGKRMSALGLPSDVRAKLQTNPTAQVHSLENKISDKLEAQQPKAASDTAANKITPMPQESESETQVHVVAMPQKTVVQQVPMQSSNDGGALIKVRNDEPSAAGLVASIFEHPASYGGVYRM